MKDYKEALAKTAQSQGKRCLTVNGSHEPDLVAAAIVSTVLDTIGREMEAHIENKSHFTPEKLWLYRSAFLKGAKAELREDSMGAVIVAREGSGQ